MLDSRAPCDNLIHAPALREEEANKVASSPEERDGGEDQGTEEWEKDGRPSESGEALKSPDTRQTISPSFCYLCLFCSRCAEGAGQGKS